MCMGAGLVRSAETAALSYFRTIWQTLVQKKPAGLKVTLPPDVASYLLNRKRTDLANLESTYKATIIIESSPSALPHEGHVELIAHEVVNG